MEFHRSNSILKTIPYSKHRSINCLLHFRGNVLWLPLKMEFPMKTKFTGHRKSASSLFNPIRCTGERHRLRKVCNFRNQFHVVSLSFSNLHFCSIEHQGLHQGLHRAPHRVLHRTPDLYKRSMCRRTKHRMVHTGASRCNASALRVETPTRNPNISASARLSWS